MKKKNIIMIVVFMILAVLSAIYVVALRHAHRTWIQPLEIRIQTATSKALPLFFEDQKSLAQLREVLHYYGASDAGPYLNKIIPFASKPPSGEISAAFDEFSQTIPKNLSPLTLSAEIVVQMEKDKSEVFKHFRKYNLKGIDFRWMKDLEKFDHWELMKNSPFDFLKTKDIAYVPELPVLNLPLLQKWAKLRLIKGLQEKQMLDALKEVRHLAVLSYSTESVIGGLVCNSMLNSENEAYYLFLKENPGRTLKWTVIETDQLKVLKRLLFSSPGFVQPLMEPGEINQILNDEDNLGICGGLRQSLVLTILYRPLLDGRFRQFYSRMDQVLPNHHCRIPEIKLLWENAKTSKISWRRILEFDEDKGKINKKFLIILTILSPIPPTKVIIGEHLLSIRLPNWLGLYDQNTQEK